MNRAAIVRAFTFGKALMDTAKAALNQEGQSEWVDQETRISLEVRGVATAHASISNPSLEVTDEQAFLKWLVEKYPSEIMAVLKPRNPEWFKMIKDQYAQAMIEGKIDSIPGVKLDHGGNFISISVTPDRTLMREMKQAIALAMGGNPAALRELFQGAGYAPALEVMPPLAAITGGPDGQAAAGEDAATAEPGGGSTGNRGGDPASG